MPQKPTYEELEKRIRELEPAEASLRASEALFRTMVETSPMGISIVNDRSQYTYINNEFCRITGYSEKEILGEDFFFVLAGESRQLAIDRYTRRQRGESVPDRYEVIFIKKDQSRRIAEVQSTVFTDTRGRPNSLLQVYDITDRKRTEAALKESEKKYRVLVENAGEALFVAQGGKLKFINPRTESMIGYSKETLTARSFVDFIHPDDRALVIDRHLRRLQGEDLPPQYAFRIVTAAQDIRWVDLNVVAIEWDGQPATLNFMSDITARKLSEDSLRKSEENYRFLFENASEGILISKDGRILLSNPALSEISGYPVKILISQPLFDFIHPEDRQRVMDNYSLIMAGKSVKKEYSFRIITAAGSDKWVEVSSSLVPWDDKPATLSFFTDITDRKAAEAEKEKLQELLNQSQKMESIGRLAGGVAHDFNNMLGVIIGQADLAIHKTDPAHPLFKSISEIHRAAQRATDLTRQLLAFARKQTISPKQLFLNDTVSGMISMLRRLIGEDIHLIWEPGANLWPVKMDPAQVDQILANLCVNARDAISGVGNIIIRTKNISVDHTFCTRHPDSVPGDYVRLSVKDDGCGMDTEIRGKLFEPFFTTKAVGQGTGLGLSMIYGIVRQNNGFISVTSHPGKGTTFDLFLPTDTEPSPPATAESRQKSPSGGAETLLVVEDEAAILEMVQDMLENMGYQVLPANTPSQAIDIGKTHPDNIDLLMTDVIMPEMNGKDLARNLVAVYPGLKTLFMSGYTADVIAHHGILEKNVAFIQKPFSMNELADRVRDVLDKT